MTTIQEKSDTVAAVEKAFAILECLGNRRDVSVTELAQQLGLSKSSVHRLLQTLKALGYVAQDGESELYRATLKLFELGGKALENTDLVREADEDMRRLGELTRETIHLGALDEDAIIYIHKIESDFGLRMQSRIGRRKPLHSTAIGKVLLAHMTPSGARALLESQPLKIFTPQTLNTVEAVMQILPRVWKLGFAEDNEEAEPGLRCIAVPVFDRFGKVVAALSISFPTMRCDADTPERYTSLLKAASQSISGRLGWRPEA
ncbi:IclR family KDG regulon transcriptional repressor [Comamonas odontotermitis]|uniref:IclR family KDG regulon transcriptional repressor n=1 Tax=Comamonas odontotermitis TaxID=379895 RepID=A0ABR6RIA4_9BURK|nr:DNA-binding transcriptional regulator KdgR [Comamonas odontotermitis]MBB6578892.1 IclR family KDG regulon transcriptional repressor [Comamonas odontotermitis]